MKLFLVFITLFFCFTSFSQVDTIVLDYSKLPLQSNKYDDAIYIVKIIILLNKHIKLLMAKFMDCSKNIMIVVK